MMLPNNFNEPSEDYKPWKKDQFERTIERTRQMLEQIKVCSLNKRDKNLLLKKVKKMVNDFYVYKTN